MLRDVTERRRAQQEREAMAERLMQAEKLQSIGLLAGGIAHDFNNQLTGILGFADILRRCLRDEKTVRTYAEHIHKAALNASELTGKLLAFSRKGPSHAAAVNLHDVISDM